MRQNNVLAERYRRMHEIVEEETIKANEQGIVPPIVSMVFNRERHNQNPGTYNTPTSNEIAAIFVGPDGEPPFNRDIRVYLKNQGDIEIINNENGFNSNRAKKTLFK